MATNRPRPKRGHYAKKVRTALPRSVPQPPTDMFWRFASGDNSVLCNGQRAQDWSTRYEWVKDRLLHSLRETPGSFKIPFDGGSLCWSIRTQKRSGRLSERKDNSEWRAGVSAPAARASVRTEILVVKFTIGSHIGVYRYESRAGHRSPDVAWTTPSVRVLQPSKHPPPI